MMDNNIPEYYQYLSRHIKVMDRARIAHVQDNKTDELTDMIVHTLWTLVVEYKQLSVND
jgi:hypothetical protein